ncbi:MAG: hypothetical protein RBS77_05420 [Candidatus Moranbacteria bacterium]|jgi:hypothetical protein|nr:hypothetical protein [Candidatus Moranbacteria bacterium]
MFSKITLACVLGLKENIPLTTIDMAKNLRITFFPYKSNEISNNIENFAEILRKSLINSGVNILPFDECLMRPTIKESIKRLFLFIKIIFRIRQLVMSDGREMSPYHFSVKYFLDFVFGRKIKRGIAMIMLGSGKEYSLPMDYVTSFKDNPIVTILDKRIKDDSNFSSHMEEALNLFSWNMTNLVVTVDDRTWTVYSFNLSNPVYELSNDFEHNIINSLVTKISAPVIPPRLSEFIIKKEGFNLDDESIKPFINDMVYSGTNFKKTNLFPDGKKLNDLRFRNYFYRLIGSMHLDDRSGMSYGYLARQLPLKVPLARKIEDVPHGLSSALNQKEFCEYAGERFLKFHIADDTLVISIPDVYVITSRSGSNKTELNPHKDIIKIGLSNGNMILETPVGVELDDDYKPSYDSRVILAHALANALLASIIHFYDNDNDFLKIFEKNGLAIAHWHGYLNVKKIPAGYIYYGQNNPSVSCSAHQAAIYAFNGKIDNAIKHFLKAGNYIGDIHIEPHHGINITFSSLMELSEFLIEEKKSELGNQYLNDYI